MNGLAAPRLSEPFRVSSARMAAFAGVFGADAAGYNPVFAHVPVMQSMVEALGALSDVPGVLAEHDFTFHAPIRPGTVLTTHTDVAGTRAIAPGLLVRLRSVTRDGTGAPVTTQIPSVLLRGVAGLDGLAADPSPDRPVTHPTDAGQVRRFAIGPQDLAAYAEAARDYAPYTLDAGAARARISPRFTTPLAAPARPRAACCTTAGGCEWSTSTCGCSGAAGRTGSCAACRSAMPTRPCSR